MSVTGDRLSRAETLVRQRRRTPRVVTADESANIVEFVVDRLGLPLYPVQATLLKLVTLQTELFTDFDYDTVVRLTRGFAYNGEEHAYEGDNGLPPDIFERIDNCRTRGCPWFNEVLLIFGRRAGKGYLASLLVAWRIWQLLVLGDPQRHYGMSRGKSIGVYIYSVKFEQAKRDLFADVRFVLDSPLFDPFRGVSKGDVLTFLTPAQLEAGAVQGRDVGNIEVRPASTTATDGRGPAAAMIVFDEVAHLHGLGSTADSVALYKAATPGLAQFKQDKLLLQTSSPWEKTGALHDAYINGLRYDAEKGQPAQPSILPVQLASWDPYEGWQDAHRIPMWPGGPCFAPIGQAIIDRDDPDITAQLKRDPDAAAVEFLGHFRSSQFAYLRLDTVKAIFAPWNGRELTMAHAGTGRRVYVGHADPARSGANFALAIGHVEIDDDQRTHIIYDLLKVWRPDDFADGKINYITVDDELFDIARRFRISDFSFDQYNSAGSIDRLRQRLRDANLSWRTSVYEITATQPQNWRAAELFKSAANQGLVHAPPHPTARLELEFLQEKGNKLTTATSGPVRTKDLFDAMSNVAYVLSQNTPGLGQELHAVGLRALAPGPGSVAHPLAGAFGAANRARAFGEWEPKMAARRVNPHRR